MKKMWLFYLVGLHLNMRFLEILVYLFENLNEEKYNVLLVGITKKGEWYLYSGDIENINSNAWENDVENKKQLLFLLVLEIKVCTFLMTVNLKLST